MRGHGGPGAAQPGYRAVYGLNDHAPVRAEHLPGDEGGRLAREEGHDPGDVLRPSDAAEGGVFGHRGLVLRREAGEHVRVDGAGGHGVHADARGSELLGKPLDEGYDRPLRRGVRRLAGAAAHAEDGGSADYAAALALHHVGYRLAAAVEHPVYVYVEKTPPFGVRHVLQQTAPGNACVADEQVEGSGGLEHGAYLRGLCDIRAYRLGAELGGEGFGPLPAVQVVYRDAPAVCGQRPGLRRAYAAGGAGHKSFLHKNITRTRFYHSRRICKGARAQR